MITLKEKIRPDLNWLPVLEFAVKDELVKALKFAGYRIPKGGRKKDYVWALDDILHKKPEAFLHGLSWDSLTVIRELVKDDADFVARPASYRFRDIQNSLIALTYTDNYVDYFTLTPDVREALDPIIDSFMEGQEARLHRLLDPCLTGLANLYGLCPMLLIFDYLKEFGLFGNVEGINIDEKAVRGLIYTSLTFLEHLVVLHPDEIPEPYSQSELEVEYVSSPSCAFSNDSIRSFFYNLTLDGIVHPKYKRFTKSEVLAAGQLTPDFLFPEAVSFKEFLSRSGFSSLGVLSEFNRCWILKQEYFERKEELHFKYDSPSGTSSCDDFLSHLPLWVRHGYSDTITDEEVEDTNQAIDSAFERKKKELNELEKQEIPDFLSAFTRTPALRPDNNGGMAARLIPHNGAEFTIDAGNGLFFVCYALACPDSNVIGLYACWKRCFDAPLERFMTPYGISPSDAFIKKYKLFGHLLMKPDSPLKPESVRISLVSIEDNPKLWYVSNMVPDIDWAEVVFLGPDKHPELVEKIMQFFDVNKKLFSEIEHSDSKSFKAALQQLYEA